MAKIKMDVHNLFFIVDVLDKKYLDVINRVNYKLTTFSYNWNKYLRRLIREPDKGYYVYDKHDRVYRYPIMIVKTFMLMLGNAGVTRHDIDLTIHKDFKTKPLNLMVSKKYTLRDYQVRYVNAIKNNITKNILLVDLYTGGGKGLIACSAIVNANERTAILVLPRYVDKWIDDIKEYTNIKDEDICVIQGSKSLINLMYMKNVKYKVIIFSLRTIYNYITEYEDNLDNLYTFEYPVKPQHLMEHLKIGTIFNDETHQHFHQVMKCMMYFNAKLFLGSTATFNSNRSDLNKVYTAVIPPENRVSNLVRYDAYINVKAIRYRLQNLKRIRYKRQKGYNHILFEESIIYNQRLLNDYTEMIDYYVKESYIDRRVDGDKILIFAASVKLCTILADYFSKKYKNLKVRRYVEDDNYENIKDGDIICSTVLSAGTAFDIPNLITVLQTVSITSLQANLQSFGRLRKLAGKESWFYYIYCGDITNQYKMHVDRANVIREKAKVYIFDDYYKILNVKY